MNTTFRIFDAAIICDTVQATQPWGWTPKGDTLDEVFAAAIKAAEGTTHIRVEMVDEDGDVVDAREGETGLVSHEDEDGHVTWA